MKLDPFPRFFPMNRAVPLSDAVFAVVMTLLVLGIEVPSESGLSGAALDLMREKLAHQVLVYFVCFSIIAMYWFHHSLLFDSLKRMDRQMMLMNLMFLMPVTLLPFVTQFGETSGRSSPCLPSPIWSSRWFFTTCGPTSPPNQRCTRTSKHKPSPSV